MPKLKEITSTEFVRNFSAYQLQAQREPVAVSNHGKITGYFVAKDEYEAMAAKQATLQEMSKTELAQKSVHASELSDDFLKKLDEVRMDPKHDHLNKLMSD